jgi:hypothetical protein
MDRAPVTWESEVLPIEVAVSLKRKRSAKLHTTIERNRQGESPREGAELSPNADERLPAGREGGTSQRGFQHEAFLVFGVDGKPITRRPASQPVRL